MRTRGRYVAAAEARTPTDARANTDERSSLARDSLDSSHLCQHGRPPPLPPSLDSSLSLSLIGRGTFEDFLEEMELATCR